MDKFRVIDILNNLLNASAVLMILWAIGSTLVSLTTIVLSYMR